MPLKTKVLLDKVAWQWAEAVDFSHVTAEHVKMAYRLNLAACERGSCKRNCKSNPFCLHNLGEKKWLAAVDDAKLQTFDAERVRRQKGDFVGLKNLGATCYVNTFLQLWFHNTTVRRAIYEWRSPTMPDVYYDGWKPDSVCGHLQLIFALLQCSNRSSVDPTPLIEYLELDAGEQQDAQEFSKLFLHVLERSLYGNDFCGRNVIEEQFCGRYCYVTVCQNCGSQSEKQATFYELDLSIRGHSTLLASIKDFLQEEKLEGDNQYMCSVCNSKQNATRMIKLKRLPPVLNLQLLRFVFDKTKGHKKKLSSFIQFPETLDMTPYVDSADEDRAVYELAAVLIHGGPSAFSGHYIAHIREQQTGAWYKFNDDDIEKVNNKKLQLGKEDDPIATEGSSEKAPKVSKGNHSSRYAYMLVYHQCKAGDSEKSTQVASLSEDLLPGSVRAYVDEDNKNFEKWISDMLNEQEQNLKDVQLMHEEMKVLYSSLPVKSLDEPWEWISVEWLSKWLADPASVVKVENKVPYCPHNKLLPEDVMKMKCVASDGAELVFLKYPINKRYPGHSLLCEKCILQKCREIRFRNCMTDDDKLFTCPKYVVATDPSEEYFWVSTKHLRSWKKFAIREIAVQSMSFPALQMTEDPLPVVSGSSTVVSVTGIMDEWCPLTASVDSAPPKCKTLERHLKKRKNLTYEESFSISLPSSSSSSPQSSTSPSILSCNQPSQKDDVKNSKSVSTSKANSSDLSHGQSYSSNQINTVTNTPNVKKRSKSPSLSGSNGFARGDTYDSHCVTYETNHGTYDFQNSDARCGSPDSDTIVLKKTTEMCNEMADEFSDERLSPECLAIDRSQCALDAECGQYRGMKNCIAQEGNGDGERKEMISDYDEDDDDDADEKEDKFNDDILCEHGNLRIDESGRRLVSKDIWIRLLYYFPHLKPFTQHSPLCEICLVHQHKEQQLKESRKLAGQGQKDVLQNLYHGKNRPKIGDNWTGRVAYIVSSNFVEGWRKFVKHSMKSDSVQEIVNAPLLCEHNLLLYKPEDMNSPDNATRFTLVWKEEWDKLIGYFEYDVEIEVVQLIGDDGLVSIITLPGVCSTCLNERIRQEEEGKFIFSRQVIYIRKILDGTTEHKTDDPKENGKGYNYDPEFNAPPQQRTNKARGACPPPEKQQKLDPVGLRKSSRHRKTRGEKEVIVSSSMTLKELKIQLFNLCSVPPFDQNLWLDGRSLKNDESTLQDLQVYPNCVIFLKADEPTGEATSSVDDYLNVPTGPEEGFKGTNLLGR